MRARVFSLLCIVGCAFIAGCQAPRETTKPSITIVAPPQGSSYVAGESVSVHSAVADPSGIARVELYADGAIVAQDAPPVPKQQQLQVIQQWKATGAGQHTLLVRAYNLANATSESGIVINVTAPAAVASPTTVAVAVISPTVPLATIAAPTGANAVALTSIPSTPVPPTPIPPTPIPSTPIPPTAAPQPTAFVIDLPPFDGGQNVSIIAEGTGVRIQAGYSVLENTQIDHVDMSIMDGNGKVIAQHRENNEPYCYQGDTGGNCNLWDFAQHGNKWHNGAPAREGLIFVRGVAYSKNGKIRVDEVPFWLDPSGNANPPPNIFVGLEQTGPGNTDDVLQGALTFEVSVGNSSPFNIDHVDMYIVKYDGTVLHKQTERNPPYCAFGDQNSQCNPYVFNQHGNKWPNGAHVFPTMVILRAIAYAGNQPLAGLDQPIEIRP